MALIRPQPWFRGVLVENLRDVDILTLSVTRPMRGIRQRQLLLAASGLVCLQLADHDCHAPHGRDEPWSLTLKIGKMVC